MRQASVPQTDPEHSLKASSPPSGDLQFEGQALIVEGTSLRSVRLADEWFEDVVDPQALIAFLKEMPRPRPDLLTFWQRLPDTEPRFDYYHEVAPVAAIRVRSYQDWWKNQIKGRTRSLIRKAERMGLRVREASFDDDFVRGVVDIFNETPIRQGRPFHHYGKDLETVKCEFSRFLFREDLIAAYYQDEMIGFVMLAYAGPYALAGQIISKISHRNMNTNNALIAKAVELCAAQSIPHLVYSYWTDDSLAEFKRRCGFERVDLPRYYVPLTHKGGVALKLGMHRGLREAMPPGLKNRLKAARRFWYNRVLGKGA